VPKTSARAQAIALDVAKEGIDFLFPEAVPDDTAEAPPPGRNFAVSSPMRRSRRFIKRALDIGASLVMLVAFAPLFVIIALIVSFDSPGGFLFRQKRVGKNGRIFDIYKFRTMERDEHTGGNGNGNGHKSRDRVTRVGKLLRRTSLDELPQIVNVLRGEMSLVGPRPEMLSIVERYTPLERARLAVTPGITGPWQLSPYRNRPIHEHLYYDLYYIQHQSLTLDFVLLLQTIFMACRGA
jgi:lipopolysaccharide/colanic/teichoic acid biosynthesis glycosyltransferase